MGQDTKRRIVIGLVFAFVPAVMVYSYFAHIHSGPKVEVIDGVEVKEPVRPQHAANPRPLPTPAAPPTEDSETFSEDAVTPAVPAETPADDTTLETDSPFQDYCNKDLKSVSQEILELPFEKEALDTENFHFTDPAGEHTRLFIQPSETGSGNLKAKFFKLDQDGLPTPIETPVQYQGKAIYEIIQGPEFTSPLYHDKKAIRSYPNGLTATIKIVGQDLESFESVGSGLTIRCFQNLKCACQAN